MSKKTKVIWAVGIISAIFLTVLFIRNENFRRWIAPTSVNSRDLVKLPNGTYVEAGSLQRDSNGNFIPPTGTATPVSTAKWIPAEVHEIPFHPVFGAVAGQMMGQIKVPAGKEVLIFSGLTSEWDMAVWYHTSSTNLVVKETYNGTTSADAKAGVTKGPTPPPHLDQVWSLSVFVPTDQSPTDLTVGWRLSRK